MKYIVTNRNKLDSIEVVSGQLIFVRDDRVIYLDSDVRTPFTQMIYLTTEEQRQNLVSPLKGFYFVEETSILWFFTPNEGWKQTTKTPDERLVFDNYEDFPTDGKSGTLYCDPKAIYQWDEGTHSYLEMGKQYWGSI